ncbi:hypothetical protein ACQR0Z_11865, partial [Bradyrhizobium sp. HKCCYLS3077]|uniref:hypothetical protein n=1 Tax=Bradyrhizobium sp. HKCCYLS3077 TaxID=3420761 RepID=UPI003EBFAF80
PGSNSQVELEALNRLITTFDEVPPIDPALHSAKTMVLPLKHCPPKSSRPIPEPKAEALNPETRKDSAVHVSLSSSSLVKQPALVSSRTQSLRTN